MLFFKKISRYAALASGNFEKIFKDREVPTLPQAVMKLLEALRDPEVDMNYIAEIISSDPGLSTQILRLVNSAFYGFPSQITTINKAISILGLKKIENIAISYGVMKSVEDPKRGGFDFNLFWSVSLYRAIVAREIARKAKLGEPEEAFTGALLQDIALPVLLKDWFDVYKPVYEKWLSSDESLHSIEDEELSWNHAQAGAWLAKKWELPAILVCCIGLHTNSVKELGELELKDTVVSSVAASSKIPTGTKKSEFEEFMEDVKQLGLSLKDVKSISEKSYELLTELASSFGIREVKVKPLEECLKETSS